MDGDLSAELSNDHAERVHGSCSALHVLLMHFRMKFSSFSFLGFKSLAFDIGAEWVLNYGKASFSS